jgi:hypothetical protein
MVLTGPLEPTRARLAKTFPVGPTWVYEPKWDGFRCLLFRNAPTSTCNRDRSRVPVATATVSGLVCEKTRAAPITVIALSPPVPFHLLGK